MSKPSHSFAGAAMFFLLSGVIWSCAQSVSPQKPPENYKGPIEERPEVQSQEYWIYERPDGNRIKLGTANSLDKPEFPLWVGKIWQYRTTASLSARPPGAGRTPAQVECQA